MCVVECHGLNTPLSIGIYSIELDLDGNAPRFQICVDRAEVGAQLNTEIALDRLACVRYIAFDQNTRDSEYRHNGRRMSGVR